MKIWHDDEFEMRKSWFSSDWTHCRWPCEVITNLQSGKVEVISLDHDLADNGNTTERTGYDVLKWIEEQVYLHAFVPPRILLHTRNSSARDKMKLAVRQIILQHQKNLSQIAESA